MHHTSPANVVENAIFIILLSKSGSVSISLPNAMIIT